MPQAETRVLTKRGASLIGGQRSPPMARCERYRSPVATGSHFHVSNRECEVVSTRFPQLEYSVPIIIFPVSGRKVTCLICLKSVYGAELRGPGTVESWGSNGFFDKYTSILRSCLHLFVL